MVLDNFGSSLRGSLDKLRGKSHLDENDVQEIVKEIQCSLLSADVDVSLVMDLSDSTKTRALEEESSGGTSARDHVLKIVYEELVDLIGESTEIPLGSQIIMLVGLQGSGKTATSAKMAWWFSKKGLRLAVIQTDTFHPGAYDQVKRTCERAKIDFYGDPGCGDPVQIAREGPEAIEDADVHIVDTVSCHVLEDDLIDEIEEIEGVVQPDLNLFVPDVATGQGAKEQVQQFDESIDIGGVVITKLGGTAKGGGALIAVNKTDSSIAFLGIGETVQGIERFEPSGFISRLLGIGDLEQLSERVERAMSETQTEDEDWDPEEMTEENFTLKDIQKQMEVMDKMGPLDQVLDTIPGFGGGIKDQFPDDAMNVTKDRMRSFEVIVDSTTEEELGNLWKVGASRVRCIAQGSGQDEETIQEPLKQHCTMRQTIKQFQNMGDGDIQRTMKKLQNQGGGGGDGTGGLSGMGSP